MELWVGAISLGFLYAFMTMGVYITFRVYDFPDITVDGSFTTGAAAAAVLITTGFNPILSILAGFFIAAAAGSVTALIHTRLNVNGLLSGILVMTGLYSVNLHVMGRSNIPLLNETTAVTYLQNVRLLEMQLEGRLDDLIGTLSGGQRQALTLLMAVITHPRVLLLDEHTAALDPKSARQVVDLTRRFVNEGKLTTLMVTHSMQQALELGSRTIMMHKGEIIDDISAQEKTRSTADDLLARFAELRKAEKLTPEMLEELRREYI